MVLMMISTLSYFSHAADNWTKESLNWTTSYAMTKHPDVSMEIPHLKGWFLKVRSRCCSVICHDAVSVVIKTMEFYFTIICNAITRRNARPSNEEDPSLELLPIADGSRLSSSTTLN